MKGDVEFEQAKRRASVITPVCYIITVLCYVLFEVKEYGNDTCESVNDLFKQYVAEYDFKMQLNSLYLSYY